MHLAPLHVFLDSVQCFGHHAVYEASDTCGNSGNGIRVYKVTPEFLEESIPKFFECGFRTLRNIDAVVSCNQKDEVSNTKDAPGYTRNGAQPRHVHGHDERGGRYSPTLTARTRSTSRARRSFVTWLDSLIQDIGFSAGQARKIFGNPTRNLKASLILPRYSMCSFPVIRGQGSLRREPVHRSAWQAGW